MNPSSTATPGFASYSNGGVSYFDGIALASYVVTRGIFENPLTREPLTWDDCRRLEAYVHKYQPQHDMDIRVCEAYGLKESVRVGSQRQHTVAHDEATQHRLEVLRSEAAAALCHLFVFGRDRRGVATGPSAWNQGSPSAAPPPRGGFNLNQDYSLLRDAVQGMDGLCIIDDDEHHVNQVAQEAWVERQEAFPPLPGDVPAGEAGSESTVSVGPDRLLLQSVRRVAEMSQRTEREKEMYMQLGRQRLIQEAQKRQQERKRARKESLARQALEHRHKRAQQDELKLALAEIDEWREQQWEHFQKLSREAESKEMQGLDDATHVVETTSSVEDTAEDEDAVAAKWTAKLAAKRKRARERRKARNAEARERARIQEEREALEKKRAESAVKCSRCGIGLLDSGFDKFGYRFCSTKCARQGPFDSCG